LRGLLECSRWAQVGSRPAIGFTLPATGDTLSWSFSSWSDGGAQGHQLAAVHDPETLSVTLSMTWRVRLFTSPSHLATRLTCGIESDNNVASLTSYENLAAPPPLRLRSSIRWVPIPSISSITGPTRAIFRIRSGRFALAGRYSLLSVQVNQVAIEIDDSIWAPESLNCSQVRAMADSERKVVSNVGNIPIDLGLMMAPDTAMTWVSANLPGG